MLLGNQSTNIFILDYLGHPVLITVEVIDAICSFMIKIYLPRGQRARVILNRPRWRDEERRACRSVARFSRTTFWHERRERSGKSAGSGRAPGEERQCQQYFARKLQIRLPEIDWNVVLCRKHTQTWLPNMHSNV